MALERERPHPQVGQHQALRHMVDRFVNMGSGRAQNSVETGPDGYDALRAILIEIDETMLPRRITLDAGHRRQVDLYASNRRLMSVKAKGLEPETALNSPEKLAQHFAQVLRSVIAGKSSIRLRPPQKVAPSKDAGVSVSTDLLARALGLGDRWNVGDPLKALQALSQAAIASLHAAPSLSFSCEQGPETELGQLKTFWREYTRNAAPKFDTWGGHDGRRENLAFALDDQKYLIVVKIDHVSTLLALLPREHLNALAKA